MTNFRIYWLSKHAPEIVTGINIADAFRRIGFSHGILALVDYYEVA